MNYDFILQLLAIAAVGVGQYAAIKADLARALHKAEMAHESADDCRKRIDRHIEVKH